MQPIFRYFRRKRMVLNGKTKLMPVAEKPLIVLIFPDFTEGVAETSLTFWVNGRSFPISSKSV
jgi:hypothetical protein